MSRIRADRYTNRAGTGAPTFADGVNVVGITSVNPGAGTTSMLVTGDLSVISGTIKGASELSISGITSSISDTAVDVFVYDTRKDSDGGAWRKRTQNTSWYNDTLNSATRGSRREFPAVAVIVAEASKVTIYDGDDPDLPLWMSFPTNDAKAVTAINGEISLGAYSESPSYHDLLRVNFVADQAINHRESGSVTVQGYFIYTLSSTDRAKLNDGPASWTGYRSEVPNIVNGYCNDIAMTVLPNAPIDDATGLPIPTIAVATNGGVSVIKDDGNVVDITSPSANNDVDNIQLDSEYVYFTSPDSGAATEDRMLFVYKIPSVDINNTFGYNDGDNYLFTTFNSPPSFPSLAIQGSVDGDIANMVVYDKKIFSALPSGIAYLDEDSTTNNAISIGATNVNGSVVYASTSYNTGWMYGDIKGAFLSDTSTVSMPGSNLITNGDFSNGSTGWSLDSGWTVSSGTATCDGTNDAYIAQPNTGEISASTVITVTITITAYTSGTIRLGATGVAPATSYSGTGTHSITFRSRSSFTSGVELMSINFVGTIDDVIVTLAEEDRSVNDNGVAAYGTITKSAVATGADLVAYSGFSASNNLVQLYNSDLNFGTGNFCFTAWIKKPTLSTNHYILDRNNGSGETDRFSFMINAAGAMNLYAGTGNAQCNSGNSTFVGSSNWRMVMVKRSGGVVTFGLDGKEYASTTTVGNWSTANLTGSGDENLFIGQYGGGGTPGNVAYNVDYGIGEIANVRLSASAPSPEQFKKMYEDEKHLYQENAKATLYGSSDVVTALAYDDTTELLHVGTSAGRSEFQGLRRINNTTTAVTTAISASNELVAEQ